MAHREVIATRTGRYGTRMLTAGEPMHVSGPEARALIALGRAAEKPTPTPKPPAPPAGGDLTELRAEYTEKLGKRPFNGWDAATLREKIDAA